MRILQYPEDAKLLRVPGRNVALSEVSTSEFQRNLQNMRALLREDGMALAATQVGWPVNLFLLGQDSNLKSLEEPIVCLNPEILSASSALISDSEGCLSFRGLFLELKRPASVTWRHQDLTGKILTLSSTGYFARAIMHEIDHLRGRLFVDLLPPSRQSKVKEWLRRRK